MTKRTSGNGVEVVELGLAEKVGGGLALAIVTALLLWIGNEVQSLAVRMARVETRLDIQDRLSGGGQ